jgi:hypothetical protein
MVHNQSRGIQAFSLVKCLITRSREHCVGLGQLLRNSSFGLAAQGLLRLLLFVKVFGIRLTLALKTSHEFTVLPSNRVCQVSHNGKVSARLQSHDAKGSRDDDTLLLIERSRNSLKARKTLQSILSASGHVVAHTADSAPDHHSRALEMERTSAGVGVHLLLTELSILDTVTNH